MKTGGEFKNQALNKIRQRILNNIKSLGNIIFKHVLRAHNQEVDSLANKAMNRRIGLVKENQEIYEKYIP